MPSPKKPGFDASRFLSGAGSSQEILHFKARQRIFAQGDRAEAVFYIQKGKIKLSVVSSSGKEAVLALLSAGEFIGEDAIPAAETLRVTTATAISPCSLLKIARKEMIRIIHEEPTFSDLFVKFLLARSARIQDDLVDQLFNSSEKRLARVLLLLAQYGKGESSLKAIPKISQETLAEMVGTTRSRVSFFMNRFRKLGLIQYNGEIFVHASLVNVILHD